MVKKMEQKPRPWQQPESAGASDGEGEPGLSEDESYMVGITLVYSTHVAAKIDGSEGGRSRFLTGPRNSVSYFLIVSPSICNAASRLVSAIRQINTKSESKKSKYIFNTVCRESNKD